MARYLNFTWKPCFLQNLYYHQPPHPYFSLHNFHAGPQLPSLHDAPERSAIISHCCWVSLGSAFIFHSLIVVSHFNNAVLKNNWGIFLPTIVYRLETFTEYIRKIIRFLFSWIPCSLTPYAHPSETVRLPWQVHERGTVYRQPSAQPPHRLLPLKKNLNHFCLDCHSVCDNVYRSLFKCQNWETD